MRRSRAAGSALVLRLGAALAVAAAAPSAQAEPPNVADVEEARKHYARGVALYEQGADAASLAELERAYELAPNWKVLYELGVVELALHDFASALKHFERYLAEGQDGVKPARKQEVQDHVARLRQQVGTIDFVTVAGAEIVLDDVVIGTTPFAKPLIVNPGHHKLVASKDGLSGESRLVSIAGGDHSIVELSIPTPSLPVPPPAAATEPPPAPVTPPASSIALVPEGEAPPQATAPVPPPRHLATPWIGWIATGALASGAIATGVAALAANEDLTHAKADGPSSAGTLSSLSSRAHAFALASDIMTGATVVAGGVTLYFTLRSPAHPPASVASFSLGLGPGRLSLQGIF